MDSATKPSTGRGGASIAASCAAEMASTKDMQILGRQGELRTEQEGILEALYSASALLSTIPPASDAARAYSEPALYVEALRLWSELKALAFLFELDTILHGFVVVIVAVGVDRSEWVRVATATRRSRRASR